MKKRTTLQWIVWVLIVVGALNWGLVGLMGLNLVEKLLGAWPMVVKIVYDLVGLAALYKIWALFK